MTSTLCGTRRTISPSIMIGISSSTLKRISVAWAAETAGCVRWRPWKMRGKARSRARRPRGATWTTSARPSATSAWGGDQHVGRVAAVRNADEGRRPLVDLATVERHGKRREAQAGEAHQDGERVAEDAEAFEPLVGPFRDVGGETESDEVQEEAASAAVAQDEDVGLTPPASGERFDRGVGAADMEQLGVARELWIETRLEDGLPVPEPAPEEPSGRVSLRMPSSLHAKLIRIAERQGVSLNLLLSSILAEYVGRTSSQITLQDMVRELTGILAASRGETAPNSDRYDDVVEPSYIHEPP